MQRQGEAWPESESPHPNEGGTTPPRTKRAAGPWAGEDEWLIVVSEVGNPGG